MNSISGHGRKVCTKDSTANSNDTAVNHTADNRLAALHDIGPVFQEMRTGK